MSRLKPRPPTLSAAMEPWLHVVLRSRCSLGTCIACQIGCPKAREVPRSRSSLGTNILVGYSFSTGALATAGIGVNLWLADGRLPAAPAEVTNSGHIPRGGIAFTS